MYCITHSLSSPPRKPKTAQLSISLLLSLALLAINGFGQQIIVEPNVHVSRSHSDLPHYETLLAADPGNPKHLLGGSMVLSATKNGFKIVTYVSFDGGSTWEPTLEVDEGAQWGAVDPAYAYGLDGTAYFVYVGQKQKPDRTDEGALYFYRSKDGGKTWLPPTRMPIIDRPYIAVDTTRGKYHGQVYVNGVGYTVVMDGEKPIIRDVTVFRSADGGMTFDPPVRVASAVDHYVLGGGNGVVLSDGTIAVLFGERRAWPSEQLKVKLDEPNAWLKLITSDKGGEAYSFSKAVVVNDWYMGSISVTSIIPTLAVDQSNGPFRDRLYAAWPDYRFGRCEILLAYSSDKGKSWSKPAVVNDDQPRPTKDQGPDDFMPVVAVNSAGVVGVMWYDRRDNPDNLAYWVRFSASLDGGETFLPSVRVSEAPNSPDRALFPFAQSAGGGSGLRGGALRVEVGISGFTFNGGHTAGMSVTADGLFHPFWVDNRTGVPQIWTAV